MFETPELASAAPPAIARFAVFGSPIAHSLSPTIQRRFAEANSRTLTYSAMEVDAVSWLSAWRAFVHNGGVGANLTLPLKAVGAQVCSVLDDSAQRSGVVNTLTVMADGAVRGSNTDGAGLVEDITERLRQDLRGRRVLLLGAGGAAAGVLPALLDAGVDTITIANRNPARADQLSDRIGSPDKVSTVYWQDLTTAGSFDAVFNATAAGHARLKLDLPFGIVGPRSLVYDLNYGRAALDFLAWGRTSGAGSVCDGLGMLVEQAAEAFFIWHGVRPETAPVFAELHEMAQRG